MVYRSQDIDALKQEIESLKVRRDPTPATQQDIHNVCISYVLGTFLWKGSLCNWVVADLSVHGGAAREKCARLSKVVCH